MTRVCRPCLQRLALVGFVISASATISIVTPVLAKSAKGAQGSTPKSAKGAHSRAPKSLSQTLTGTAKADFEAAKLLAGDGDYASALIKFVSAYEASKDPRLLWNLAFCQKNLRHYAKVLTILRRYLDEGGSSLTASDRTEAQDLIALIEPFTTRVVFQVTPEAATVTVDDELVGTSPLPAPVVLDIGERRIRVAKDGYRSLEKILTVGGTSEVTFKADLEKEVHEGRLLVNSQNNAHVFLDGKEMAIGKLELSVASGGHQLRVVAPGMRPYQTEVVVTDKETRSMNIVLEAVAPAAKPRIRVAVGCADSNPRAPEEGLTVSMDGPDLLPPALVKRTFDAELRKDVTKHVEYEVTQGLHKIRVNITDCQPLEEEIYVAPDGGREITGALESDHSILLRGPLGSPGWFRLSLGLWLPAATVRAEGGSGSGEYIGRFGNLVGAVLELGLVSRWFGVFVTGALATGNFDRASNLRDNTLPDSATTTWKEVSLRLGPRFPLNVVALGLGPHLGVQEIAIDQVRTGRASVVLGGFVELDVQPLCDWGLYVRGSLAFSPDFKHVAGTSAGTSLSTGIMYQPSAGCHTERKARYGLFDEP